MRGDCTGPEGYRIFLPRQLSTPRNGNVVKSTILRRYTRALRKGGHLLIDQPNRERILRNFIPERVDGTIVTHSTWHADTQRLVCRRTIGGVDDPKNTSSTRLYTPGQIKGLFTRVGMVVEELYGSSKGGQFISRSSRRMIVVGRKP
jgi:hypothetical protein